MYKAVLITTEGCEGCRIMRNILEKAIYYLDKDITLEVADCKDKSVKKYINLYNISDFPNTLLLRDKTVTFTWTGTYPIPVVKRWLEIHL